MAEQRVADYLTWVEQVLDEVVRPRPNDGRLFGIDNIGGAFGLDWQKTREILWEVVEDLERMRLVENKSGGHDMRVTQEGLKVREGIRLATAWPSIVGEYLTAEQQAFLGQLVELSLQEADGHPVTEYVQAREVFEALAWPTDDIGPFYDLSGQLTELGLAKTMGVAVGGNVPVRVTYAGVVRATQKGQSGWQRDLPDLIETWETTSVEFKRQLSVRTKADKAEFVRDMLALATTQASGRRLMIVGFDPKTRAFFQSMDPKLTVDHVEDVLNEYVKPALQVRLHRVAWEGGEVGIVEAIREPAKIPYEVRRGLGPLIAGQHFVRHGTHIAAPDPEELEALVAEGRWARAM